MYFPNALILIAGFTAVNTILIPMAYIYEVIILFNAIFDEVSHLSVCQRVKNFLLFTIAGPFFLLIALILDPIKFAINLYDNPAKHVEIKRILQMESLNRLEEVCEELEAKEKRKDL